MFPSTATPATPMVDKSEWEATGPIVRTLEAAGKADNEPRWNVDRALLLAANAYEGNKKDAPDQLKSVCIRGSASKSVVALKAVTKKTTLKGPAPSAKELGNIPPLGKNKDAPLMGQMTGVVVDGSIFKTVAVLHFETEILTIED